MLNTYPLWKNLLIVLVVLVGGIYAAPNLYPDDYAVQVSGASTTTTLTRETLDVALESLDQTGIAYRGAEVLESGLLIRVGSSEEQLRAKAAIARALGNEYVTALNLAATTPDWLTAIGAGPMKLGLDLRGGVHFLMEVDMAAAVGQRLDVYVSEIKTKLRSERIRYRSVEHSKDGSLAIKFASLEARDQGHELLSDEYREFRLSDTETQAGFFLGVSLLPSKISEIEEYAIKQNLTTIRNRVNELGVAEPLVQRQGSNRIVIQLPGVQDTAAAKRILGKTANLEFRLEAAPDAPRSSLESYEFREEGRRPADIERDVIINGSSVSNAQANFDENGQPQVSITLDSSGGKLMNRVTRNAIQRRMAVLFIEHKSRTRYEQVDGVEVEKRITYVEKKIISLATIQSALGNSFRITGLNGAGESTELALLLRAGALAAPIYFVEERTVGPSLGQQNIDRGVISVEIGMALVLLFMLAFYRVFGLVANVALVLNLALLTAAMSMLSATLTLPGIAGIVLTVGMAVDANVLIFSRIKEELRNGLPPQSAISAGYDRAFSTIFDANITTLLVAVILFAVGTGPVKGFAVTLSLGIIFSMFTSITVTRALINQIYGGRKINKLSIGWRQ
ncbi:MAG: preprotein translocase subunit SecD [Motiliproteus sp.]|jgi:preprotein translocase subunit SecD